MRQEGDMYAASKIEPLTAGPVREGKEGRKEGKKRGNVLAKNPIHSLVNRIPPFPGGIWEETAEQAGK